MSKDIFVVIEQQDGEIQKVSLELLGKARELAGKLKQNVVGVLMGLGVKEKAEFLIQEGADKVLVVDDPFLKDYLTEPYAKALTQIIKKEDPEIVLFGASSIGRDLAPRVSARIHTGLTADCTGLEIEEETNLLLMTRPAFGGNIMATIICPEHRPQMATVRPGVMEALKKNKTRSGSIENVKVDFNEKDREVKIREVVKTAYKTVDICDSKILVSVGRGIKGKEGLKEVQILAKALDAEVSSSRAIVDSGWLEKDRQVGQTGKTVRPDLYLACGISGAIQHVAGMEGADCIIAINKNETAPIFEVADLGIVGDLKAILPKLSEQIKKIKREN